jgi:hypothetical protein
MALFRQGEQGEVEGDADAAKAFKSGVDEQIAALKAEADALTGKDNKKARTEKSKQASDLSKTKEYIDAELILKGKPPKNGNFVKAGSAPAPAPAKAAEPAKAEEPAAAKAEPAKTDEKKASKKVESAGISKAERDELEKLKTQIVDLKKQLKDEGMSGGQMNKDERVVKMVTRMNELKEKESPGSTAKGGDKKDDKKAGKKMSKEAEAEIADLTKELEEYSAKLKAEYGYTKKDMMADPDYAEMQAKLNKLTGKK